MSPNDCLEKPGFELSKHHTSTLCYRMLPRSLVDCAMVPVRVMSSVYSSRIYIAARNSAMAKILFFFIHKTSARSLKCSSMSKLFIVSASINYKSM